MQSGRTEHQWGRKDTGRFVAAVFPKQKLPADWSVTISSQRGWTVTLPAPLLWKELKHGTKHSDRRTGIIKKRQNPVRGHGQTIPGM